MITDAVAIIGAAGVVLMVVGLPPLRRIDLAGRVEPYLSGLHGRASRLLVSTQRPGIAAGYLERIWERWRPGAGRHLTERLAAAGEKRTAGELRLAQLLWGMSGLVLVWAGTVFASSAGLDVDARALPVLGAIAFSMGFLGVDWSVTRRIEARREILRGELPVAIDLITLSIMAGESVPAAFARVAGIMQGEIGREFAIVVADIRSGETAIEALESLKDRISDYSVARLVDALCTGIEKGAPLAEVLRAQADDIREAHRRRLLELGGTREVLMLVPVVFLIMPVVVVFALFPGLLSLDLLVP